jgi:hypothetical protein
VVTKDEINERLVRLYADIAAHGYTLCSGQHEKPCKLPHSCCDPGVCDLVIEQAKWDWDVEMPRTGHPKYPLMNPDGSCSAPPHMRPLCALHCCCIAAFGFHPTDHEWTERYFELRNEINNLEFEKRYGDDS